MPLDPARTRQHLAAGDFRRLFIEELGWDTHSATIEIPIDGRPFTLSAVAQKRGMVAFHCRATGQQGIPDYPTRRKIDRQVTKAAQEHLIIYTDPSNSAQVWQWVRREMGKPTACREHTYHRNQPGDALIQKLQGIAFSLEEEERLSLVEVTSRARAAFDVERVTKRFYDTFQKEHTAFLKFLKGIPDEDLQRWYASVMLNRLMFVYFIQKKGFLDGNPDYLRIKLNESQARGKDRFYRDFLCPLFFEGFAKKDTDRTATVNRLLGKVPYLNGGLFLHHQIEERHGKDIQVADAAFARLFAFFEQYHWHLDERPLRADKEINPDVLGYIFEKYINQKQMGAYYTKEDITGYISQNTVIPFLFDAARQKCKIAFDPTPALPTGGEGVGGVWRLLQLDPDRYIYEPVKRGVIDEKGEVIPESALPEFVRLGMHDPKARMFEKRYNLGEADFRDATGKKLTLPTETWREYVERRKRCLMLRERLAAGEIRTINELITYNLNIRQFAQDVIENSEGPELLRAFYHAIEKVTVLDPTCGSGAFLFAALNILEPLYEACLDRMEVFVDELARSGAKHRPEKFSDFRNILDRVASHPNRRYFILKSIILNNLYGVDIMEEAVEICKLRLFLKLVAQVERVEQIEPLPDIDFNIRVGNTLVGYAGLEDLKKSMEGDWVRLQSLPTIEENAEIADRAFQKFHEMQTEHGMEAKDFAEAKEELRRRLKALEDELNRYLAHEYGVLPPSPSKEKNVPSPSPLEGEGRGEGKAKRLTYDKWLASHKPFHWFIEFYRIMKSGGFDVIIGNPPYVELSQVKDYSFHGFETSVCGNLYCPMVERTLSLADMNGRFGMIVPLSLSCTERVKELRDHLARRTAYAWLSHFSGDANPSKLFEGVKFRLNILLGKKGSGFQLWSSKYLKWFAAERPNLFTSIEFCKVEKQLWHLNRFPKIGNLLGLSSFAKLLQRSPLGLQLTESGPTIYVHRVITMFIKCFDFVPYFRNETDGVKKSEDYKPFRFGAGSKSRAALAGLNSSAFFFYFVALGDCFHCGREFVLSFPLGLETLPDATGAKLEKVSLELMSDLRRNAIRRCAVSEKTGDVEYDEFWPNKSKLFLDQIDCVLAKHYGFTDEELDFIINYDIKYRMGQEAGAVDS